MRSTRARSSTDGTDLVELVAVAITRGGVGLRAIDMVDVPWSRSPADPDEARRLAASVPEARIAQLQANRVDDGFYSTFVVRRLSKPLTRVALRLGWTPNAITLISFAVGIAAAGGVRGGRPVGARPRGGPAAAQPDHRLRRRRGGPGHPALLGPRRVARRVDRPRQGVPRVRRPGLRGVPLRGRHLVAGGGPRRAPDDPAHVRLRLLARPADARGVRAHPQTSACPTTAPPARPGAGRSAVRWRCPPA